MYNIGMRAWRVTDYTGATSVHYASDGEHAIQKHLVHFGLIQGLHGAVSAALVDAVLLAERFVLPCVDKICNSVPPTHLEEVP